MSLSCHVNMVTWKRHNIFVSYCLKICCSIFFFSFYKLSSSVKEEFSICYFDLKLQLTPIVSFFSFYCINSSWILWNLNDFQLWSFDSDFLNSGFRFNFSICSYLQRLSKAMGSLFLKWLNFGLNDTRRIPNLQWLNSWWCCLR